MGINRVVCGLGELGVGVVDGWGGVYLGIFCWIALLFSTPGQASARALRNRWVSIAILLLLLSE